MLQIASDTNISQTRCNKMKFVLCSLDTDTETFYYVLSSHGLKEVKYLSVNVNSGLYSYDSAGDIINDILKFGLKIYPNNYPSKLYFEKGSKIILEFTISDFESKVQNILDIFVF